MKDEWTDGRKEGRKVGRKQRGRYDKREGSEKERVKKYGRKNLIKDGRETESECVDRWMNGWMHDRSIDKSIVRR